jgi:sulfur-carrier protein
MKFDFTGNLRRYVDFDFEIELEASSVMEGLHRLTERYPAVKEVLFDAEGKVRSVHRVLLNGAPINAGELDRATAPDDEVAILTPIAGG